MALGPHLCDGQEEEPNEEGSHPVDANGNGCGSGTGVTGEDLINEEPGDGARACGEHDHKQDDQHDGEITDPGTQVLEGEAEGEQQAHAQHTTKAGQHESLPAGLLDHDERDNGHGNIHGTHGNSCVEGSRGVKAC